MGMDLRSGRYWDLAPEWRGIGKNMREYTLNWGAFRARWRGTMVWSVLSAGDGLL